MNQDHDINSVEELRNIIGHPRKKVQEKVTNKLDEHIREFINHSPFALISTSDNKMRSYVSPRGDAPGFVKVHDDNTLLLPERPGNKLAFGYQNIIENGQIGLIFMVPRILESLRIRGTARLSKDPELLEQLSAQGKPAILCTIINVETCWMHCGKALIRSKLWDPESWSDKTSFSFSRQVAEVINVAEDLVHEDIQNDYKNNLY